MWHAAINQSTHEWFLSWCGMVAYNLYLRAGCEVIDASLEISGALTTTLSVLGSSDFKS